MALQVTLRENSNRIPFDHTRKKNDSEENAKFVEIFAVYGHTEMVTALEFSRDGKLLASGADDGSIKVWNVETSKVHKHLMGHKGRVMDFCWSKDNTLLASASLDRDLRIWDIVSGKCFKILRGHTSGVFCCDFHPSFSFIVSGSANGEIYVWDVKNGICIKHLERPTHSNDMITSVCFNKNGTLMISGNIAGHWCIWDMSTYKCFEKLGTDPISCIHLVPAINCVVVATSTGCLDLWVITPPSAPGRNILALRLLSYSRFKNYVATLRSPNDYLWIVCKSRSGHGLYVWDGREKILVQKLKCHTDKITSTTCHPTTRMVVTAAFGDDNMIKIWKHSV